MSKNTNSKVSDGELFSDANTAIMLDLLHQPIYTMGTIHYRLTAEESEALDAAISRWKLE